MKEKNDGIADALCRIAGITEVDRRFGEPFIGAFGKHCAQRNSEVLVASYTCSLFLSAIFNKFPTERLHTFVHFTKEHYSRFTFNCKMYENIFAYIGEDELKEVALLGKDGETVHRQCSKQEIFEAFDFYTNT